MTDGLPQCVVCHPNLDLDGNPIALCPQHGRESPLEERVIKRDPSILDRWIMDKRQEVQRDRA